MKLSVLYLHGFASSPTSVKASIIGSHFQKEERDFYAPDLNCGDFTSMTISKDIEIARKIADSLVESFVLIGSSLGGYTAALTCQVFKKPPRGLVLLAPAFHPTELWKRTLTKNEFSDWRNSGKIIVEHYSWGREVPLSFHFYEDIVTKPPFPDIKDTPCIIFHGNRDESVPIMLSMEFATRNKHVKLYELNDTHDLLASIDLIKNGISSFLESLDT